MVAHILKTIKLLIGAVFYIAWKAVEELMIRVSAGMCVAPILLGFARMVTGPFPPEWDIWYWWWIGFVSCIGYWILYAVVHVLKEFIEEWYENR